MIRLVPFLFFCSGATALIYEVVWSKYLSLIFGSTVQAQTVVLAVFMGGLALGNWLFGRRADLLTKPLAFYGWIEIALGLYAIAFHALYILADGIFIRVGTGVLEQRAFLLLIKGGLSVVLLLGPTVLMGGTLPLLAGWLQRRKGEAAQSSARFYAINTLGAVVGAGLAGFVLVRQFGVQKTLFITAGANILIGIIAIVIARAEKPAAQTQLHNSPKSAAKSKPGSKKETTMETAAVPSASSALPFPMLLN